MGKYIVRWCRIWEFIEEVESETEEELYEKVIEERATQGSEVEIISVMPIDIEEVKQKGKKEKEKSKTYTKRIPGGGALEILEVGSRKTEQKSEEKK